MDELTNKTYKNHSYTSRYSPVPYFYNNKDDKYIYGLALQLSNDTPYTVHMIGKRDTLDSLSLTYYGRPDFYWVIADYNHIQDPFISLPEKYTTIKIPTLTRIEFKG